jgi:hypothetical protein
MGDSTDTPNASDEIRAAATKRQNAVAAVVDHTSDAARDAKDDVLVVGAPPGESSSDAAPKGRRSGHPQSTTSAGEN